MKSSVSLPDDYTFDVPEARAQLAALALKTPDARITLTLAHIGDGGLEAESDIWLKANEAAALLEQVQDDQRILGKPIYVLRISESKPFPESKPISESQFETPQWPPRDDP